MSFIMNVSFFLLDECLSFTLLRLHIGRDTAFRLQPLMMTLIQFGPNTQEFLVMGLETSPATLMPLLKPSFVSKCLGLVCNCFTSSEPSLLYQLHHGSTTQKIRVSGVPLELALNSTFFLKQSSWIYPCLASEVGRELEKGGVEWSKYDLRVTGLCLLCLADNKPTPRVSPPLESIVVFPNMGKDGSRGGFP